jgi:hypothetical protein
MAPPLPPEDDRVTVPTMTASEVSTVNTGARHVSRRVLVAAPPAQVFDLIADPHRHPEIDGSGTVRNTPVVGPPRLSAGAAFTVGMKQYGVPYKITSKVTKSFDYSTAKAPRLLEVTAPPQDRGRHRP